MNSSDSEKRILRDNKIYADSDMNPDLENQPKKQKQGSNFSPSSMNKVTPQDLERVSANISSGNDQMIGVKAKSKKGGLHSFMDS